MINLSIKVVLTKLFKVVYILSFLLAICSAQGGINDEQYIGCYQDNAVRDIGISCPTIASMTITSCRASCQQRGLTYAGAQYGTMCCCGDSYGKYGPSTICNVTCAGSLQDFCGNSFVNSVYSACPIGRYGSSCNMECHCANQAPCFISNGTCPNNCAAGWTGPQCNQTESTSTLDHYGCFNDNRNGGFPQLYVDASGMTIAGCVDRCRTAFGLYAGLQYRSGCYCGDISYSYIGLSTACGTGCPTSNTCSCTGDTTERCGGANANDIYSVCQNGYYGELCIGMCHCADNSNCSMEDGTCPSGGCTPGWMGTSCNTRQCSMTNGNCDILETCNNELAGTGRSVSRCRCANGYNRTMEYQECQDIDECKLDPPDNQCNDASMGSCINYPGSYNCSCQPGYENNSPRSCQDIDECALGPPDNQCDDTSMGRCINYPGSYNCSCEPGYANNGYQRCQDIDECSFGPPENECDSTTGQCQNIPGSYLCDCYPGYKNDGSQRCQDIDECVLGPPDNECDSTTGDCVNFPGSYNCTCFLGYQNNGSQRCQDIDECALGPPDNQCDDASMGRCINYPGSYNCSCQPGYENNSPQSCQDIDECLLGPPDNECNDASMGECVNYPGSYYCSCEPGYENNDSQRCQDIDECALGPPDNQCSDESMGKCINYPGSYNCSCESGYENNSPQSCQVVSSCLKMQLGSSDPLPSGIYTIQTTMNKAIKVYCEMGLDGGGYTFLDPFTTFKLTNNEVDSMNQEQSSFLMRVRMTDGTQPYAVLRQLPEYETIPVFVGVNDVTSSGYNHPYNEDPLGPPFIYFGFLPIVNASNNDVQGLQVNGKTVNFTNCDASPNSQFTLFPNFKELSTSDQGEGAIHPLCDEIFADLPLNPSGRVMPETFFLFGELAFGGCGCYHQTDRMPGVLGLSIGFR